jgi:hypothetical protein
MLLPQPNNIYEFGAQYFANLAAGGKGGKGVAEPAHVANAQPANPQPDEPSASGLESMLLSECSGAGATVCGEIGLHICVQR